MSRNYLRHGTLKVMRYEEVERCHLCIDAEGNHHRVDLFVDGSLRQQGYATNESVVGLTVRVGYLTPYVSIANDGVEIVSASPPASATQDHNNGATSDERP